MSQNKNKKPRTKLFIFRRSIALILTTIVIVACVIAANLFTDMYAMIQTRPELDLDRLQTGESSRIYDSEGELVAEIGTRISDNVTYEQMPTSLVDAFISIEDSRFFEHEGFDISRFISAAIGNIRSGDLLGGTGASTITMQVMKNAFFVSEGQAAPTTLERKVQEISMAIDAEEQLDKKTILELYVNKIEYGATNSVGVSKAAEYYFGKEVSELGLSESAYLAGVINAPSALNAYRNLGAATTRRNEVLNLMERHGYITAQENKLAQAVRLEDQLVDENDFQGNQYPYQHYIDAVINEVVELTGVSPFNVGMDIYTPLIQSQQQAVEDIQNGNVVEFDDDKIQVGLVTLNNNTGELVAIGGGRPDEDNIQRGLNRATSTYKQPGSSLKPIVDYALAFDVLGWSTNHTIEDGPYAYAGGDFVNNYSRRFSGDVGVTEAVIRSLNIPAIKTLEAVSQQTGSGYIIQYLKNIGVDEAIADQYSLGYAIGSANFQVTPVQLAAMHGAMVNGGLYIKPHTVLRIEIEGQEPIIPVYAETQVVSEQAAYLAATTMKAAVDAPSGTSAIHLKQPYPVYGKTGTTDHDDTFVSVGIPDGAAKDSWIGASTNMFTSSIWYGYDTSSEGDYQVDANRGSNKTAAMANYLMDNLLTVHTPQAIERPAGISSITYVKGTYPYAAPTEGMDESLIETSLIKSQFANLVELETPELLELESQNVEQGRLLFGGLRLNVTMTPYPDTEKLEVAPATKEMSATNYRGQTRTAEGTRAFDPSWIFGAVQYGTEVRVDGEVVESIIDENNAKEFTVSNIRGNQNLQVCSFYTWEKNHDNRSNEVCETLNSGEPEGQAFPNFRGLPTAQFENWITQNSTASYEFRAVDANTVNQVGTVSRINPDYSTESDITQEQMDSTNFIVEYYEKTYSVDEFVGRTVRDIIRGNNYNQFVTLMGYADESQTITGLQVEVTNGQFNLTQLTKSDNRYILPVDTAN